MSIPVTFKKVVGESALEQTNKWLAEHPDQIIQISRRVEGSEMIMIVFDDEDVVPEPLVRRRIRGSSVLQPNS